MKSLSIITVLLPLLSCGSGNILDEQYEFSKNLLHLDISEEMERDESKYSDIFDSIRVLNLIIEEGMVMTSADKLKLSSSGIYILDQKLSQLFCFNINGIYKLKIGEMGFGPGEFQEITDFEIDYDQNEIVIFSNADQALYFYSMDDGSFLRRLRTGVFATNVSIADDRYITYANHNHSAIGGKNNLLIFDEEMDYIEKHFPFDPSKANSIIDFSGFLASSNGRVYFSPPFHNVIYIYDEDGKKFQKAIKFDLNNRFYDRISGDFKKLLTTDILFTEPNVQYLGSTFFCNDNYVAFTYSSSLNNKIGVFSKERNQFHVISKRGADPYLKLIDRLLNLDSSNEIIFGFSSERLGLLKSSDLIAYNEIVNKHPVLRNMSETDIGYFLMIAKLK